MATVVNDRDVLIMGTTPRYTAPIDRGMFLTPPAAVFKLSADGLTASPGSFTFTATLLNMTGTVTWSTTGGISLSVNGNTATLNFASFTAVSGTITASITVDGQPFSATATVTKVADGTAGQNGVRGTINISAATGGVIWSDSDANAAIAAAGYGTHQTRDVVTLYNQAGKFSKTRFWDGSAWQDVSLVLDGNLLVPGSVNAQSLAVDAVKASTIVVSGSPDNVLPDPKFKDLTWWNRVGYAVGDWSAGNTSWKLGASLYIGANGGTRRVTDSKEFALTPGATYLIEVQVSLSSNFNGNFSVFCVTGDGFSSIGQPNVGTFANLFSLPIQYNSASPKTLSTFSAVVTLSISSANQKGHITVVDEITAGTVEFGSLSITRVSDNVLIKDGAVTATKMTVVQLDAITARIGLLRTATSGARTEIADNVVKMFADNNQKTLHLGDSTK